MSGLTERFLGHIRRADPPNGALGADAELLARYVRERNEDAFSVLVGRYGGLVSGVCRRVLRDSHEAEDAFQATFLVLARKAGQVREASLAAWLHGVARQVALNALRAGARRQRLATDAAGMPPAAPPGPLDELTGRELLAALDEEVQRLPEATRLAVLLCCLEGLSQEEAARRLGCSPGSLKGRLERGRKHLQERLARRGLTLAAVFGVAEVAQLAAGAVPEQLLGSTTRAATLFAAGQAAVGASNARAAALAEGVLRAMFMTRLKIVAVAMLITALAGTGAAVLAHQAKDSTGTAAILLEADAPKTDQDALQGAWIPVAVEEDGKKVPKEDIEAKKFEMVFTGNKVTLPIKGETQEVTYRLDPKKDPRQIDFLFDKGTAKGIYSLKGNKLTLCAAKPDAGERPTKFEAPEGTNRILIVLEKKK
jgi:RNA polymerase sigma factor (sigma-70 family)